MDPLEKLKQLTDREREVLALYAQGLEYKDIAEQLYVAENTIRSHVGHIYTKLQLNHLPPKARLIAICEDYLPLLEKLPASEEEVSEEPEILEPPPPELEQMIDEDSQAIRALQVVETPPPLIPLADERPRSRLGGCIRLAVLLLVVAGAGALLVFGWDTIEGLLGNTPLQSPTTDTVAPTARSSPTVNYGPIYEVGEWHEEGDVWYRLFDYEIEDDTVWFLVEMWNRSSQSIYFHWTTVQNTFLRDNLGNDYELHYSVDSTEDDETVPANTKMFIEAGRWVGMTTEFEADNLYLPGVTEAYFTLEYFSRVEKATWRIPINH